MKKILISAIACSVMCLGFASAKTVEVGASEAIIEESIIQPETNENSDKEILPAEPTEKKDETKKMDSSKQWRKDFADRNKDGKNRPEMNGSEKPNKQRPEMDGKNPNRPKPKMNENKQNKPKPKIGGKNPKESRRPQFDSKDNIKKHKFDNGCDCKSKNNKCECKNQKKDGSNGKGFKKFSDKSPSKQPRNFGKQNKTPVKK